MSFKPSVSTDGGATFDENALAFATREEAEAYAKDLMAQWMLVTDWCVVKSEQPVNYAFKDGVLTVVDGMNIYTVLCVAAAGGGTTWIGLVGAPSIEAASVAGRTLCADDLGWSQDDVHVLGVLEGASSILYWRDVGED